MAIAASENQVNTLTRYWTDNGDCYDEICDETHCEYEYPTDCSADTDDTATHADGDGDMKDAIKDAIAGLWERYADEEAVEQWIEERGSAFEDLADRHEQETAELVEETANQVENALDGALKEMAEDLAEKTDDLNVALQDALQDFYEAEAEAIEHIDDQPWNDTHSAEVDIDHYSLEKRLQYYDDEAVAFPEDDWNTEPSEDIGDKINDGLARAWDRYIDDDAVNEWIQETEETVNEMNGRHNQEQVELAEVIAKQVEQAVDDTLKQMAEDLSEKTDEANQRLNDLLDKFMEKEAETIEHIDDGW